MRSGSVKNDSLAGNSINQQPVRVNVALEESCEILLQFVLAQCHWQRASRCQQCEYVFESFVFESMAGKSPLQTPEVAHELAREYDFPHRRFRYAIASLAMLKR